ncbi:hypothetical protein [Nocardia vaccinii]|uniref:hypothetical protein n=1 Tax=Nocardia vaccinii TaxID=1822 RepID=UPI00157D6106
MTISGKTVLVTEANRGIGQALVAEALHRGAERVHATSGAAKAMGTPERGSRGTFLITGSDLEAFP